MLQKTITKIDESPKRGSTIDFDIFKIDNDPNMESFVSVWIINKSGKKILSHVHLKKSEIMQILELM